MSFVPGQVLANRYCLYRPLGTGRAGRQTWQAWDLTSHPYGFLWRWPQLNRLNTLKLLLFRRSPQPVTIKLLAFNPQLQWSDFKLFEREAEVLRTLDHPQIPHYADSLQVNDADNGVTWLGLVQQFIPGQSLGDRVTQQGTFNESQVKALAKQGLEILSYLHGESEPILHRDIKPSNWILDQTGKLFLIDFGAVQTPESAIGLTLTIVGSQGYAPMEQYWGQAVPASDLYGFGMTLIYCLTGQLPQNSDLDGQKWLDHLPIAPRFAVWLQGLTHPQVDYRFASASLALGQLESLDRPLDSPRLSWTKPFTSLLPPQKSWHWQEGDRRFTVKLKPHQSLLWSALRHKPGASSQGAIIWGITLWSLLLVPGMLMSNGWGREMDWDFWQLQLLGWGNTGAWLLALVWDAISYQGGRREMTIEAGKFTLTKSLWVLFQQTQTGDRQELVKVIAQPENPQSSATRYRLVLVTTTAVEILGQGLSRGDAQQLVQTLTPLCSTPLSPTNPVVKSRPVSRNLSEDVTIP